RSARKAPVRSARTNRRHCPEGFLRHPEQVSEGPAGDTACRQARGPRRAPADDRRSFVAPESNRPRRDPPCGEKAEAQESTELLHARVVLPAAPPPGGADSEPDLVAGGCAINGLKHQFEREALLHLADHDQFG